VAVSLRVLEEKENRAKGMARPRRKRLRRAAKTLVSCPPSGTHLFGPTGLGAGDFGDVHKDKRSIFREAFP